MPRSPEPQPGQDPTTLTLVPADALQRRVVSAIKMLERAGERVTRYVEFGVYNGTSLIAAYHGFQQAGVNDFKLIGFDSFEGLPSEVVFDDGGVWKAGQFRCPQPTAEKFLQKAGLPKSNYALVPGWFSDTLNDRNHASVGGPVSIVMIDSDTFQSATAALRFIGPLLAKHSIIFFDDWRLNDLDLLNLGEKRAFGDFLRMNPQVMTRRFRSYNRKSAAFVLTKL